MKERRELGDRGDSCLQLTIEPGRTCLAIAQLTFTEKDKFLAENVEYVLTSGRRAGVVNNKQTE